MVTGTKSLLCLAYDDDSLCLLDNGKRSSVLTHFLSCANNKRLLPRERRHKIDVAYQRYNKNKQEILEERGWCQWPRDALTQLI